MGRGSGRCWGGARVGEAGVCGEVVGGRVRFVWYVYLIFNDIYLFIFLETGVLADDSGGMLVVATLFCIWTNLWTRCEWSGRMS